MKKYYLDNKKFRVLLCLESDMLLYKAVICFFEGIKFDNYFRKVLTNSCLAGSNGIFLECLKNYVATINSDAKIIIVSEQNDIDFSFRGFCIILAFQHYIPCVFTDEGIYIIDKYIKQYDTIFQGKKIFCLKTISEQKENECGIHSLLMLCYYTFYDINPFFLFDVNDKFINSPESKKLLNNLYPLVKQSYDLYKGDYGDIIRQNELMFYRIF